MKNLRRVALIGMTIGATSFAAVAASMAAAGQQKDDKIAKDQDARPKLTLRAQPMMAIAPARVVFSAELTGGSNDFQEYYCPTIEWEWGDDTRSESTIDCDPYEQGKSEIKRRFTIDHTFKHGGYFRVSFRLKHRDKSVATATTNVQVRPGLRDGGR